MDITDVDSILNDPRWAPRHGWHDDHRHNDRKPEYLPALQQVRVEFFGLMEVLRGKKLLGGRALQLGMGECRASHAVWRLLFPKRTVTIDWAVRMRDDMESVGADTHDKSSLEFAELWGPYDFLFIDAGHKFDDVARDHADYGRLVVPGGIIAFHDAAKRPGYEEEIDVWRYLAWGQEVTLIGSEVGVAWVRA